MKNSIFNCLAAFCLLVSANSINAQVLNLGTISNFVVFTGNGAIANTGASVLTGDVGADLGAISLSGATIIGTVYNTDAVTAQAALDLQDTYIQLMSVPVTNTIHTPAFGSAEILTTGVYLISGAGSLAGSLTLDGQSDPNAVFIFRFGGAFNSGATSSVILTNGTLPCNVFWISEGGMALASSTVMKGTLLSHNGAVSMAVNCDLEGRLLSTAGAISFGPSVAALPLCVSTIPVLPADGCNNIDLGSLVNFAVFTTNGAVGNTGTSTITGDIGADIGAISGFGTATVIGSFYNTDAVTAQAATDLSSMYIQLISVPITSTTHTPAFGGGETLTTGVYLIAGAGSLAGNLSLDAAGDPDAVFIFRFGGAFTTGAASAVTLLNGALACNVFWVAEGAISMAALTTMKGTLLANNAANSMAVGGDLEGRMFSTTGAIAMDDITLFETGLCVCVDPLPVEWLSFNASCNGSSIEFDWEIETELNNHHFSIERSTDTYDWEIVSEIPGEGNSTSPKSYSFIDQTRYGAPSYFRLSQTDLNGTVNYYSIVYVKDCNLKQSGFTVTPNPSSGVFGLAYDGNIKNVVSMIICDLMGNTIFSCEGFESVIFLNGTQAGMYVLKIDMGSTIAMERLIVEE